MDTQKQNERIIWFDVVRGLFIFLALWHHYAQDVLVWYMDYFKERDLLSSLHSVHQMMIGQKNIPTEFGVKYGAIFVPWVNQIYLTMAAFNLASRNQAEFSKVWLGKLYVFALLFLFFLGEKFIIAKNLGEALALYPIMSWMVILSIISVLFRFMGIAGVIFLFVLAMSQWILPLGDFNLEVWLQQNFHPYMNLDASINFFAASGAMGFMLGYLYYHKPDLLGKFQWVKLAFIGVIMFAIGNYLSEPFFFDKNDLYSTEHAKASTFMGTVEILGIQIAVLASMLLLHFRKIKPRGLKLMEWVGINSLAIFAFHRIFFIHMWMPLVVYYCSVTGQIIPNTTPFLWFSIAMEFAFVWFLMKTKMLRIIMRD